MTKTTTSKSGTAAVVQSVNHPGPSKAQVEELDDETESEEVCYPFSISQWSLLQP